MKLKDISINSEFEEIVKAVTANRSQSPNDAKGDIFLIEDFKGNLNKRVELLRDLDGEYFEGTLESVKVDITNFETELNSVLYLIKLKEIDSVFQIQADSIEYNKNNLKKYYFENGNKIEWRIVFF